MKGWISIPLLLHSDQSLHFGPMFRRIQERKNMYSTTVYGRFFSPRGHNFVRPSFETDGWILTRRKDNSYRACNDPLGIFVGVIGCEGGAQPVVVGSAEGGSATGTR